MLKRAAAMAFASLVALPVVLHGGRAGAELFPDDELQALGARVRPNLELVLYEDIIGRLPREIRPAAADLRLELPLRGPGPLAFYADPARRVINMPLESIRFYDEVAILFAWFQSRGCPLDATQSYLYALLREGRPLGPPLSAFAIDREAALADPFTDDVSSKIFSSGLQFILAHEVGHLMLGHRTGVSPAESRRQEVEADAFAMEHFARLGGIPAVTFYFLATWWQDPVDGAETGSTHPVSPDRLAAVAERMAAAPMDFAHGEADPAQEAEIVARIARETAAMAAVIADDGLLTVAPLGFQRDYPLSRLAIACPTP